MNLRVGTTGHKRVVDVQLANVDRAGSKGDTASWDARLAPGRPRACRRSTSRALGIAIVQVGIVMLEPGPGRQCVDQSCRQAFKFIYLLM